MQIDRKQVIEMNITSAVLEAAQKRETLPENGTLTISVTLSNATVTTCTISG